jgi:Secretion system C-terminal sorting domain
MKKNLTLLFLLCSGFTALFAQDSAEESAPSEAQHRAEKIATERLRLSGKFVDGAVQSKLLTPLVAGQDCNTAIPVCQNTYTQGTSYTGVGVSNELSGTCLAGGETNSVWYVFTVQTSGVFTFNINTPNDYDWALYNITNSSCSSIPSSTPIRCNFSATYGNTGMTTAQGTTAAVSSLGAGDIPFSPALNVVAGQTYVLIVDNFSANTNGYTLSFNTAATGTGGTSTIFDNVNPTLLSVTNNCNNTFTYNFSEPIRCSSIATSAFTVSGGLTITAATGVDCGAGGTFTRKVLVTTSAPAACGSFNFNATAALQDGCGNPLVPGAAIPKSILSASISATRSAAFVCAGSGTSVSLSTVCSTAGATYAWSNGANTQTISVAPTASTTYTVTVTADGCSKTASTSVAVNALPIVAVDKLRGVLTPACNPFNATASGPAGTTFVWSPGGATTATLGITTAGTYTVVGTFNGCSAAPISVTVSATPSGCNVLYASPTGGGTGFLPTSPALLSDALTLAECLGATVRLQVGTYNTNTPYIIPSNVVLDGGWAAGFGLKTSTTGLTTINRTATGVYPYDGTAVAPALVAMTATSASGFRLQDIKITTANAPATVQGQSAVSTYGLVLTACSAYNIVRAQITPGAAGNGINGVSGTAGGNGTNGAAGQAGDDSSTFGICNTDGATTGGARGTGGAAGTNPSFPALNGTAGGNGGTGGNGANDNDGAVGSSGASACGTAGAGGSAVDANTGCGGSALGNGKAGGACATAGTNGANGTNGTASIISNLYAPGNGTNGGVATNGNGGGGGGGGGVNQWNCNGSGGSGGGGGGGGGAGAAGSGATGAGAAFGIFTNDNSGGTLTQVNITMPAAAAGGTIAGTGGNGGTAGTGGAAPGCGGGGGQQNIGGSGGNGTAGGKGGNGGTGSAGIAVTVQNNGIGAAPAYTAFTALTTQAEIYWDGKACTNVPSSLTALSGATGFSSTGGTYSNPNMSWTTTGRKDIVLGANTYTGFVDIITSAPAVDYTASVPFNVADNVFRVCEGGSLTFTSSIPTDNSITNFKWDFDAASGVVDVNSATANTTTATFNTAGASYTLIHNVTTACCGPVNDKVYIIKVEPKPNPVATLSQTICNGNSATLNITAPTASSTYTWSTAALGNSITVSPTATTAYTVEETTQYGCKRTAAPVNITVLNTPTAATATGSRLFCVGQSVNLALSATNATNYNWTCATCAVTSGSGTPITSAAINTAGEYDYVITPANVSGGTTCPAAPLNVKVIVEAAPSVTAVNSLCVGTNVILTGGARDYRLFNAAGTTQLSPASSYAPTVSANIVSGANNFQLQGRSAAGCISPQTAITIQGRNIPVVSAAPTVNCVSGVVSVTNTASGTGTLTYAVTGLTPVGTLPPSNATGVFTLPAGSTAATFQITSQYGCPSTATALSFGCALPIKLLSFTGKTNGNVNDLFWATATETNTQWHIIERSADGLNNFVEVGRIAAAGNSTTQRNYTLTDKKPYSRTYYRLRSLDFDGSEQFSNTVLLTQRSNGNTVNVFPNPAHTELNVSIETDAAGEAIFSLVDVLGRVVATQKATLVKGLNTQSIDLAGLADAVYFLQIDKGTQRNTVKVIKQTP